MTDFDETFTMDETLTKLVGYFDECEQATDVSRAESELHRDYYDGQQLTQKEIDKLNERGQPPVIDNKIKDKVDTLLGMEREVRTDPKAFPRNPNDQKAAEAATDALRFVADNNQMEVVKSDVGENMFVEGSGFSEVIFSKKTKQIKVNHIMWDRGFYDPHSRRKDFSDAKYLGQAIWMDFDDAIRMHPEHKDEFEGSLAQAVTQFGETYADKPLYKWVDPKRKRVRVLEIYFNEEGKWKRAKIARFSMLEGPKDSVYLDEDGNTINPYVYQSSYVDREGRRYGVVRRYKDLQDEHNKRRSKMLHLASARNIVADASAVDNIDIAKMELAKPNGWVTKNPGKELTVLDNQPEIQAQTNLLLHTDAALSQTGPNEALTGTSGRVSGRKAQIDQQAGVVNLGVLFDNLRQWELRAYRKIWNCVQQFWTEEKWIRVRDDEQNMKFVGLNKTLTQQDAFERATQEGLEPPLPDNPQSPLIDSTGSPVVENKTSELDVDIIIEQAPDIVNIQQEQFQMMVDLATSGAVQLPPEVLIEASALRSKTKKQMLETLKGDTPEGQQQQQIAEMAQQIQFIMAELEIEHKKAEIDKTISETEENRSETELNIVEAFNVGEGDEKVG